jgi:ATP-dependent DNA helicase DinG
MQDIWKEGGPLSRVIEGYELRPQQVQLASLVQETVERGGLLIAEAPTGVGKSLAYLIPSVLWALDQGSRVLVSTNTRNLQDQLYSKDVPIAAAITGRKLRAVVLKGRSNYACVRKWEVFQRGQIELPIEGAVSDGIEDFRAWISATRTGDLGELDVAGDPGLARVIELIRVEEGSCDLSRCTAGEDCFLRKLKRRAWDSHVVCVNHALLLGNLLGRWDILPPSDILVADECHNLPKVATDQLGLRLNGPLIGRSVARLTGRTGLLTGGRGSKGHRRSASGLAAAGREVKRRSEMLFEAVGRTLRSGTEGVALRYRPGGEAGEQIHQLGEALKTGCMELLGALREAVAGSVNGDPQITEELEGEMALWTQMTRDLEYLINPAEGDGVYWIDRVPSLRWNPIDVGDRLGPALENAGRSVVLTSATVTVGGDFGYIASLIGLTRERSFYPRCVRLDSPFDMRSSLLCLVPQDAPDPREREFPAFVAEAIRRLTAAVGKKTLVLFTSHAMLRATRAALESPSLPAEVLAQGVDGGRAEITKRFKVSDSALLLGVASFWEGVDFPGEEAEVLVIAKLPFPAPTEPVVEARSEALYAEGVDPFTSYQLPEAVIKLRQGFGRLIRKQGDRGVVVVLDRRIKSASYSHAFLDSLPVEVDAADDLELTCARAAAWFQGVDTHAREDQGA